MPPNQIYNTAAIRNHGYFVIRVSRRFAPRIPNCNEDELIPKILDFYNSRPRRQLDLYTHHDPLEALFDFADVPYEMREALWEIFFTEYAQMRDESGFF
ncbi:hypothetical protein [Komagataeibacter europaeus]|uniref:hypothetical protein n=1 Tax=Komagataeibacter europaeus TaxID=33995 RepID=UPI00128F8DE0|nr:hypothetical protein [Komagataeibacter europaeus]